MTIAEVSTRYGLSQDTLRYYERIGLIPGIKRNKSGIRCYTEDDCKWVEFAKCMRRAGLPIEALIEYLALYKQGNSTLGIRKTLLTEQRRILTEKMQDMQNTLERLDKKLERYEDVEAVRVESE